MVNYEELRAMTLGSTQEEEAVTVNTRALIDKVLARYSSENTTLRELIQNAADANATSVQVHYTVDTQEGDDLQRLVKSKVTQLVVKNNGQAFREEDWQRLKRIAEGNPDEQKIGAFGVGFYSVFADTDDPFIISGNQTMSFYWKDTSLFTRRAKMENTDAFTSFVLTYRAPGELPDLKALCQFFATSLTFVGLERISLYINNIHMLELNKKVSPSMPLDIPRTINPRSRNGWMKITSVDHCRVQLDAKFMNITHYKPASVTVESGMSGFTRLLFGRAATPMSKSKIDTSNLNEYTTASIFLRIATAAIATSIGAAEAHELERATKKPPPKRTTIAALTMSKDELDASEHESEIFENVIPSKSGRIFIGFPTHQTTGINAHIAAHSVIPTVERENIDLNARIVKDWNGEMLGASGILARILYADEMSLLEKRAKGLKESDLEKLYYDEAIHIMRQFTFRDSTPSQTVGQYIDHGFWSCTKYGIELMSNKGVLPSNKIRLASDVTFLEGLPLLPEKIIRGAQGFIDKLIRQGFISDITITDIQNSLSEKPLTSEKAQSFLKWLSLQIQTGKLDDLQVQMLLGGAVAMIPTKDADGNVVEDALPISLGQIKYNVNASKLSADIPLPPECLPFSLTKKLTAIDFAALKWREIEVREWVRFVTNARNTLPTEQNIDLNPVFANVVLAIVSKNWDKMSTEEKGLVVEMLRVRACIPTRNGMKIPKEAYFPTVKLFADLPIIHDVRNVKEKLLVALGVRKTVELTLVFERLMNESSTGGEKWSHVDLIKYLTGVREDIPHEDIRKLKNMNMCKAEPVTSSRLYKVSELYEPLPLLKDLGLPILHWPGEWRDQSAETIFLRKLGLRKFPPEEELMKLAAGPDRARREKALKYFLDNFMMNGYSTQLVSTSHVAFVPLQNDKERLVRPYECYSNSHSGVMGFDVVRNDLQPSAARFGIKVDPDIRECANRLRAKPPQDAKEAREKFEYFAHRMMDVTMPLANDLGNSAIVPTKGMGGVRYMVPRNCYIGDRNHKYGEIFDFVDFGTAANAFLQKCGSKPEPTTAEIAYRMAQEPERLYQVFQSEAKYLSMLKAIADDWQMLRKDKELVKALMKSPCLGAYRDIPLKPMKEPSKEPPSYKEMDEEEESIKEFLLARAADIFVVDEIANYNFFKAHVLAAPEDDALEKFYTALGSTPLSMSIDKQPEIGSLLAKTSKINDLHKLVLERSRLFIHSNNETVAHDARWLENNLDLKQVQFIKSRLTFRPRGVVKSSYILHKTASVLPTKQAEKPWTLFITPKWEYYDVAVGLTSLILQRPKPHSSLLLESLLSTDLMTLKHRGYNVSRILAKKQAEARLMEEERLKKVEEQRKQAAYASQPLVAAHKQRAPSNEKAGAGGMPGAFVDTPEPHTMPLAGDGGNFFTRGLNRFSKLIQEVDKPNQGSPASPTEQQQKQLTQTPMHDPNTHIVPGGDNKHTEPHRITANLQSAVQSCRDHKSDGVFTKPRTFDVKEERTFCDRQHAHNISYLAQLPSGIRVYVPKTFTEVQKKDFLCNHAPGLNQFSNVLQHIADVFSLARTTLHIQYEPESATIAFNTGGAIFCNFSFWLQLHEKDGITKRAFVYWWVTVCHELAHNLVEEHGSNHSFWTESFVTEYYTKAMAKVAECKD
ncbi:Similar to Sacsin; acc. no. Q9JLC8 [Pyronema omphalodes CBS 100304]|uniref:Similar to Sacsin acc. no. Q9JLC8 n=1 Tax=Pyronema omphalodes (strain CBS 100304) TaxID=1076935 RepID=U4L340_PYROM|nr:Similar to Sacsin; acc. no. Q9JLC8 [Pyronema omphalodes CBS 100304]